MRYLTESPSEDGNTVKEVVRGDRMMVNAMLEKTKTKEELGRLHYEAKRVAFLLFDIVLGRGDEEIAAETYRTVAPPHSITFTVDEVRSMRARLAKVDLDPLSPGSIVK